MSTEVRDYVNIKLDMRNYSEEEAEHLLLLSHMSFRNRNIKIFKWLSSLSRWERWLLFKVLRAPL